MKHLTIFLLILLLYSCTQELEKAKFQEIIEKDLVPEEICQLKENLKYFSEAISFSSINDTSFVVCTSNPSMIFLYNYHGKQILELGKYGNGPYEYINPSIVRVYKDKIYVWCRMRLKFIVFDLVGNPLFEYTNFQKAIKDFQVLDNYLIIYSAGGFDDPVIQLYDCGKKIFTTKGFGYQTNEHKILNTLQCSGALTTANQKVLFTTIDDPAIHVIEMSSFSEYVYNVAVTNFNIEKIEEDHKQFISDIFKSTEYIYASDVVTGLYNLGNNHLLIFETGKVELDGLKFKDASKRRQLLYLLDDKLKPINIIKSRLMKGFNNCLVSSQGNKLLTISYNNIDSSFHLKSILVTP